MDLASITANFRISKFDIFFGNTESQRDPFSVNLRSPIAKVDEQFEKIKTKGKKKERGLSRIRNLELDLLRCFLDQLLHEHLCQAAKWIVQ